MNYSIIISSIKTHFKLLYHLPVSSGTGNHFFLPTKVTRKAPHVFLAATAACFTVSSHPRRCEELLMVMIMGFPQEISRNSSFNWPKCENISHMVDFPWFFLLRWSCLVYFPTMFLDLDGWHIHFFLGKKGVVFPWTKLLRRAIPSIVFHCTLYCKKKQQPVGCKSMQIQLYNSFLQNASNPFFPIQYLQKPGGM